MTKAQRHIGRVKDLGCVICRNLDLGATPADAHHIYDTADRDDFLVVPLCPYHHRGAGGFHGMGERAFNRVYRTSETKLLAQTLRDLST